MRKIVLLAVLLILIIVGGLALSFLYFTRQLPTTEKTLKGRRILFVISFRRFRDEELEVPRRILEEAGATIVIASDGEGVAEGVSGMKVKVDLSLEEVEVDEYDAVIFIGGPGTPEHLWGNSHAVKIAKEAYNKGKLVGAICLAPGVLAEAGILQDKKATIFPSAIDKLKEAGSIYVNQSVVKDGNIITASGPEAAEKFGEEIRNSLSSKSPV